MTINNEFAKTRPNPVAANQDKVDRKPRTFFQGLAAGILGGAALAILLPRLFRELKPSADAILRNPASPRTNPQRGFDFVSRREHPESSGDPATLSGRTSPNRGIAFSRAGGAPGGKSDAEVLAKPGQPGQHLSFTDSSEGVHMQSRSLDLNQRR